MRGRHSFSIREDTVGQLLFQYCSFSHLLGSGLPVSEGFLLKVVPIVCCFVSNLLVSVSLDKQALACDIYCWHGKAMLYCIVDF